VLAYAPAAVLQHDERRYQQPWSYLHAIKDYVDMAAHIEAVPNARAVVNLRRSCSISYRLCRSGAQFSARGQAIRDPLLDAWALLCCQRSPKRG